MTTIASMWQSYREEVLSDWDDDNENEARMIISFKLAFYAGAHSARIVLDELEAPLDDELDAWDKEMAAKTAEAHKIQGDLQ